MNDEIRGDGPEDNLGEPIAELESLEREYETSRGFVQRLRRRLARRQLSGQFVVVSWHLPKIVLVEFIKFAFQFWSWPKGDGK